MGYSAPSLVLLDEDFHPVKKEAIIKNCYSQNLQISVWKPNFFLASYSKRSFRFRL